MANSNSSRANRKFERMLNNIPEVEEATPQSEVMTLEKCKARIATIAGYIDWRNLLDDIDNSSDEDVYDLYFDQAAELYASQLKAQLEANTTVRTDNSKVIANLQEELEKMKAERDAYKKALDQVRSMSCNVGREANRNIRFFIKNILGEK